MPPFSSRMLPAAPDAGAPDGSEVRVMGILAGGSMAHFTLPAGETSRAVVHRTVEEIWFILSGEGEMWRRQVAEHEIAVLAPGLSLTIPVGTLFQFRNTGTTPLTAIAITMPPWPGDGEAAFVDGLW